MSKINSSELALPVAFGVVLLAVAGIACAATSVDAKLNTFPTGFGADSGVSLHVGESFSVKASGLWRNDPDPFYNAGPDGNTVQSPLTTAGLTANYGTLVAQIDGGPVFAVGSSFSGTAGTSGELKFFFWDEDSSNNSGTVSVTVAVVPEASSFALMGLGLALIALRRRKF